MQRHGSRLPLTSELPFIQGLASKLANHSAAIQKARLPANLEFLKAGYVSTLSHDNLTIVGRRELFDHGVQFVPFTFFNTASARKLTRFCVGLPCNILT